MTTEREKFEAWFESEHGSIAFKALVKEVAYEGWRARAMIAFDNEVAMQAKHEKALIAAYDKGWDDGEPILGMAE